MGLRPTISCLICTVPRTGSWLLAGGLDATGLAGRPHEYFRAPYQRLFLAHWGMSPKSTFATFFERVLEAGTTENGVFTAKVHWNQFDHLIASLKRIPGCASLSPAQLVARFFPDVRYVYLRRDDLMRQVISYYRAIESNIWWRTDETPNSNGKTDEPDLAKLSYYERVLRLQDLSWRHYFTANGIVPLVLTYEELSAAYEATIAMVLGYLGLGDIGKTVIAPPRVRKQRDETTEAWLDKYLAMKEAQKPMNPDLYGLDFNGA